GLNHDLGGLQDKDDLLALLKQTYPGAPEKRLIQNAGQIWPFAKVMQHGDWVAVPYKNKPAINFAEIVGDYVYDSAAQDPYYHYRDVRWIATDVPRLNFDMDIRYSLGAFMTICRIRRNEAEARIRA